MLYDLRETMAVTNGLPEYFFQERSFSSSCHDDELTAHRQSVMVGRILFHVVVPVRSSSSST